MSVLTKQDLQDWKSNPVTRALSKLLQDHVNEVRLESCVRDTCDQTAMQAARNEGIIEGVDALNLAFDDLNDTLDGGSK